MNFSRACRIAGLALSFGLALAAPGSAEPPRRSTLEPRQIPVPAIGAPSALPGANTLPVQKGLPPAIGRTGSGSFSPENWPARRAEMQRLLEHYFTGQAPPAPGNVRGSVVES